MLWGFDSWALQASAVVAQLLPPLEILCSSQDPRRALHMKEASRLLILLKAPV